MLRILKRVNKMAVVWILVIIVGTVLTILGSYNLNSVLGRKNILRQSHIIPDFLLIDFEVKAELDSLLTKQILEEVKPKMHIQGDSITNQEKIPLVGFFDENTFRENKTAKQNYKLSKNIYKELRNFDLMGKSVSKDSSVLIRLFKNTNKIIFSQRDINLKDSYIEVKSYNNLTNEFHIFYHNIQLNVENHKLSKFITDLDKGNLELHLITKSEIKEIKNIKLKTKSTEYFRASEITKDSLGYSAKLNLLLK